MVNGQDVLKKILFFIIWIIGMLFVVIGIISLLIPIFPGFLLLFIGLAILQHKSLKKVFIDLWKKLFSIFV